MTAAQRALNGYGFDLSNGGNSSVYQASTSEALRVATAKNGEWTYLKPRLNTTDRFRAFDLVNPGGITGTGYNAEAPVPYTFTDLPSGTVTPTTSSYSGNIKITRAASDVQQVEITDFDLTAFGITNIGALKLAVIVLKEGTAHESERKDISHE